MRRRNELSEETAQRTLCLYLKITLLVSVATFAVHVSQGTAFAQQVTQEQYQAQYEQVTQIDNALQSWSTYITSENLYSYLYASPPSLQRYQSDPSYKAQYDAWVSQTQAQGNGYIQQLQAQRSQLVGAMQAEAAAQAAQNSTANSAQPQGTSGSPCYNNHVELLGVCSGTTNGAAGQAH